MAMETRVLTQTAPSSRLVHAAPSNRVLSVDVLRGITIAFMILVNDPGDWSHTYGQLEHAKWNGWTLTDLVFPNFLFIVGVSIILSLASRVARGDDRRRLAGHIVRRSVTIFALAMVLNLIPYFRFTHLRLYGVLPRIALCYLVAGLICLVTQRGRTLLTIAAGLLVGYWILMRFVPVPGFGMPVRDVPLLDPDKNLAAWTDRGVIGFLQRTIHTGVLYERTRDPEGLLSTIPAIATTLLGAVAGLWLRRVGAKGEKAFVPTQSQCAMGLLLAGLVGLASGLLWNMWFAINKNLWTSSYVLFAAGCALLGLAACYWLMDIRRLHETAWGARLVWPWLVFGSNAIVAYATSVVLVKTLLYFKTSEIGANGKPLTLWGWIYAHCFARGHSTELTSLIFGLCFVAVCFIPNWILWRRRIFVKI
jgi:predicted acyltransferase